MKYCGYMVIDLPNQLIELIGFSTNLDLYNPGTTNQVPLIVDGPVLITVPPTPPKIRRIIYLTLEYDGIMKAKTLFEDYEWGPGGHVTFGDPLISELTYLPTEEDYANYKSRV